MLMCGAAQRATRKGMLRLLSDPVKRGPKESRAAFAAFESSGQCSREGQSVPAWVDG